MTADKPSVPELRFRYKYLFVIIGVFIAGLFLLILSQNISIDPATQKGTFWRLLCEQLSTALLVGALTGGLYEYFLRKEFIETSQEQTRTICGGIDGLGEAARQRAERIADFFSANAEQRELGISHCYKEVDRFDFTDDIENAKHLAVILNDGRGWVGNYYQRFANRFDRDDATTTVVLMHPNSPAVDLHASKVGATATGIRMKIAETIRLLHRANTKRRPLKILGHQFYNTMSVFMTDSTAIVTPYFLSKVRRTPPVLTFNEAGRESFFAKLKQDVDALMLDSVDISFYTSEDGAPLIEPVKADGK